jgi:hypothetical protein
MMMPLEVNVRNLRYPTYIHMYALRAKLGFLQNVACAGDTDSDLTCEGLCAWSACLPKRPPSFACQATASQRPRGSANKRELECVCVLVHVCVRVEYYTAALHLSEGFTQPGVRGSTVCAVGHSALGHKLRVRLASQAHKPRVLRNSPRRTLY